jgi:quercetin dioxygenase-like cupin family protein
MNHKTFPGVLVVGLTVIAASALWAGEPDQDERGEAYVSTAKTIAVLRDDLSTIRGKEVNVMRLELPPGWVGERHYHTGDVFVYVLEGKFVVDVDGEDRKVFGPGEVYHEAVNTAMLARNASTTQRTRLILFQVGDKGEPLMMKAD